MSSKQGGWFAAPADGWAITRQRLVRLVGLLGRAEAAWDQVEAITDLRWWADQVRQGRVRRIPGARTICRDWGWSEYAARALMVDEAVWQDPRFRTPAARSSHAGRTPVARSEPTGTSSSARNRTPVARSSHEDRTKIATRADQHTSQTQTQSPLKPPQAGGHDGQPVAGAEARTDPEPSPSASEPPPERPGWVVLGPEDPAPARNKAGQDRQRDAEMDAQEPAPPPLARAVAEAFDELLDEQPEVEGKLVSQAMRGGPRSKAVDFLLQALPKRGWSGELDRVELGQVARAWVGEHASRRTPRPPGPREPEVRAPVEPQRGGRRRRGRRGAGRSG